MEVRHRTRDIDMGAGKAATVPVAPVTQAPAEVQEGEPTTEMKALAKRVFMKNRDKNDLAREEKTFKDSLTQLVARAGNITHFQVRARGKRVNVTYEPGESSAVDPAVLVQKVGLEAALGAASFSQADVKRLFGTNVLNACLKTTAGEHKLTVKEDKTAKS